MITGKAYTWSLGFDTSVMRREHRLGRTPTRTLVLGGWFRWCSCLDRQQLLSVCYDLSMLIRSLTPGKILMEKARGRDMSGLPDREIARQVSQDTDLRDTAPTFR